MTGPRFSQSPPGVPGWARWLLDRTLPSNYREEQLGDLEEEFRIREASDGGQAARRWYVRQALGSLLPATSLRFRRPLTSQHLEVRSGSNTMETILQDIRYGLRSLLKSPAFASVSTATLALAIGVNTAIFSLVSVVVFADLPMGEPETVTLIRGSNQFLGDQEAPISMPDFMHLQEQAQSFEAMTAMQDAQWVLTGDGAPTRIRGMRVTANLMDVWQLPPARGRVFTEDEASPGGPNVIMLSHGFC